MKLLLDTHTFLWYVTADRRMPQSFKDGIVDPQNAVFLSVASLWEATIKHSLGKLPLPDPPATFFPQQRSAHRIASLPVDESVFSHLAALPPLHRDPFDRMLIAQAMQHGLLLVTVDPSIQAYGVPTLPAK